MAGPERSEIVITGADSAGPPPYDLHLIASPAAWAAGSLVSARSGLPRRRGARKRASRVSGQSWPWGEGPGELGVRQGLSAART